VKVYEGPNLRNIALIGHGHAGKTTLVSAMLYTAGAAPRLGRVDDGSAVTDYDEEEIARKMSIATGLAFVEWGKDASSSSKVKINLLDTPGFNMFVHEAKMVLPVVDAALVVVDGVAGVEVVTQRVWNYCNDIELPRMIVVNRMDRDRADANRVMESLVNAFGRAVTPLQLPIGSEKSLSGIVDLVRMKAYTYEIGGNGKGKEGPIPANMADVAKEAHEKLVELVAEGKDSLMEEFFETGTIPEEHLVPALHEAIREDKLFPVLFTSGLGNIGVDELMDFIVDYTPAASEHHAITGWTAEGAEPATRKGTDNEPASVYVFKTMSDAFAGRISYFKVFSGVLKNDASLQNYNRNTVEKFAHISLIQGKQAVPIAELHAGDIGAVAKLKETLTGDTLGDKTSPIRYPAVKLPEPAITFAIEPKSRADEDKLGVGLHKLMEEDAMLRFFRDPQTKEFLIAGTGQQHIEVVVSKMKKRYHAEVVLKAPKVPYRETIRGKADVQGRHKKQTGGHGQYGDCKIKMEPLPRDGAEFEFVNDIFGGAIPRNFIPAVEKGIKDAAARGYLAGYPVVHFRAILYDGSYHDVDSNDLSFQMAGRIAFRNAMEMAKPTLLEPVMAVEITIPDEFAGTIMGDLNSRRGRIQGMDNKAGNTIVKAEVPMAEMLTYGADLTSMTQGRGSFSMEMHHYDTVPQQLQDKIVEKAKAARGEVKEEEE
jgi:elongation factor G